MLIMKLMIRKVRRVRMKKGVRIRRILKWLGYLKSSRRIKLWRK